MNLVLDIGGTKTRIGLVSETYKLLETSFLLTNNDYDKGLKNIFEFIKSKDVRIAKICIGIAGVMNAGKLYSSPNIKGWINKPIFNDFKKEIHADLCFENDAALAGLGESVYGSGKDFKIVAYLTIGTGVGGARIVNKKIDEKIFGFEPGHHFMYSSCLKKHESKLVLRRTFESLVSGKSINKIYGQSTESITDKRVWDKIMKNITVGIANTVYFWSPEIVILGGGVSQSDYFDIAGLKKMVKRVLVKTYPTPPLIKKSLLGDFAGIWGGIAYLKDNM